ncbi:MAG: bifunctional folylpolyglutamate synthase/dihydrofolate synthase [Acidobacteria bacterium]|jgi:dihydrofolate synthase/folylpolyglutamate synthase|nr:bifunctional folylpolyglutamate synthase/dihydrofolate synthase [Acidobacteriota bacterium]
MRPSHPRRLAGLYLAQRTRFGVKFGLETMHALVAELGHPERAYTTLLVSGTNGKGSVVAGVDAVLLASGRRVGRYTSPHLVRVNERLAVNGRDVTDHDFEIAVRSVRAAAERLVRRGTLAAHPTFFEALTAAAFVHFRRKRVEVAVLEVGLGARLDATNVADPIASAIVSVAFDHQVYLGRTLASIAKEKAGVVRRGRPTVVGPLTAAALRAVRTEARRSGARVVEATRGSRVVTRDDSDLVDVRTPGRSYEGVRPFPGAHQHDNLLVAIRLLEEAEAAGLDVDLDTVGPAISRARWPGRLEWIDGDPPLLLDGAHNPAGARALAAYLEGRGPFVLLLAAMNDKDVAGIARPLLRHAAEVVLTRPRLPRAMDPDELARRIGDGAVGARREPGVARALALARRLARARGTPVVVAGTLFLIGEVKGLLERPR